MATKNGVSRRSLLNQTVRIKAWVCTTEYHPIQQTPSISALLHSPAEPFGTPHSNQIKKDQPQKNLHLCTRGTLGQPPLFERPPNSFANTKVVELTLRVTKTADFRSCVPHLRPIRRQSGGVEPPGDAYQ
jgi:hypothetical protein